MKIFLNKNSTGCKVSTECYKFKDHIVVNTLWSTLQQSRRWSSHTHTHFTHTYTLTHTHFFFNLLFLPCPNLKRKDMLQILISKIGLITITSDTVKIKNKLKQLFNHEPRRNYAFFYDNFLCWEFKLMDYNFYMKSLSPVKNLLYFPFHHLFQMEIFFAWYYLLITQ